VSVKITDVERIMVNVPFRPRPKPWNEVLIGQWGVIEVLRVSTDDPDIVGWGETLIHYTWKTVSDEAIARVKGRNPAEVMADDTLGAGLQMALYDAVGKAQGVPMHRLLSQPFVREWHPISWWNTKTPAAVLAEEAKDAVAEGYLAHKFKARPWFDVREQLAAISAVTPDNYVVDIDWNGMLLEPGEAISVLQELDQHPKMGIYESPIKQDEIIGLRRIRDAVTHPLVEHFQDSLFPAWMRDDAVDGFVNASRGVAGTLKHGLAAAAFNKNFFLQIVGTGITTAFALQLGSVLTHSRWPMVTCLNTFSDDLITDPIEIAGGLARVPSGPGLGVTVDEAALARHHLEPPYKLEYPRQLLTVTFPSRGVAVYTGIQQLWEHARAIGTMPVQDPGANMEVRLDDGSADFDELYRRAEIMPVWSRVEGASR